MNLKLNLGTAGFAVLLTAATLCLSPFAAFAATEANAPSQPSQSSLSVHARAEAGAAETLKLRGPDARQQLLVTMHQPNGVLRDVTRTASYEATPANVVKVEKGGLVIPIGNGSAMVSKQLLRALAVLGIRLVHSRPGRPQGRGKIERFFKTVREQFLVELSTPEALARLDGPEGLRRLNELFAAWVETIYHRRVHSETGQTPLARFAAAGPPALPSPALLREAFMWSEHRTVGKTATVSLHGNSYQVDAALVGRRVELVFDPFDLTDIAVRFQGRDVGAAVPHRIGRHVHPAATPEHPETDQARPATGIDYLSLVHDQHTNAIARRVNYADINPVAPAAAPAAAVHAEPVDPDQPDMLTLIETLATIQALTRLDHDHAHDHADDAGTPNDSQEPS